MRLVREWRSALTLVIVGLVTISATPAMAHKESDAYLTIEIHPDRPRELNARLDVALRDLAFVLDLDDDGDGQITWGELKAHRAQIEEFALQQVALRGDGLECARSDATQQVANHSDGVYDVMQWQMHCDKDIPSRLLIDYRLFREVDPYHRGIVVVRSGATVHNAILGAEHSTLALDLRAVDLWQQFRSFVADGIWHIWTGPDHLLFILSLLLPAVYLARRDGTARRWVPVGQMSDAFIELVKVISGFTVSHTVTLTLSVLGYVDLPSRLVESGIAASIIVAAANNIVPIFTGRAWLVAFGFGFIHGLGFASALAGLSLPSQAMASSLGGFSLGVELGQEAIVLPLIPLAYALRRSEVYRCWILQAGSVVIIGIASLWLIQRAFDVVIPGTGFLTPP